MLSEKLNFKPLALALLPLLAIVTLPAPALAQVMPRAPPVSNSPLPMPVQAPSDPEVLSAERPALNPGGVPTFPLEEPLDADQYICGRGDVFELNFWGVQNFKLRVTVDLEGRTFISKVGYVDISGKSLRTAREIIKRAVLRYFPGLNFDLSLIEPRTFVVHVVGNVAQPGPEVARQIERAATIIGRAGGVAGAGSIRRIQIKRRDGSRLNVDLLLYRLTGEKRFNPYVLDDDVILVPFEDVGVTLTGATRRTGHFELVKTRDLAELLDLGGGLSPQATRQLPVRLVRLDERERETQLSVPFPAGTGLPQIELHAGDVVVVPGASELQRTVLLTGAIAGAVATDESTTQRRVPFVEGDTVRTLIERVGGVLPGADLAGGYLQKPEGKTVPLDLQALLVRRDFSADQPLAFGDTVVIPFKRFSIFVQGAVLRPGALPFNPHLGLEEYLEIAGGLNRLADAGSIRVVTDDGKVFGKGDGTRLKPGDTVIVPERNFSRPEIVQLVIAGAGLLLSGVTLYVVSRR